MKKIALFILLASSFVNQNQCHFVPLMDFDIAPLHLPITLKRLYQDDSCKDLIQTLWNAYKAAHQIDLYQALHFNDYQEKIPSSSCAFYSLLSSLIEENPACVPDNETEEWFSQKLVPAFYKEISKD